MNRLLLACALSVQFFYAAPAGAQYSIQTIIPPGAEFAQTFGINNAGKVTGGSNDGVSFSAFVYDMKRDEYTTISDVFSALDINNSGVMIGGVDDVCAIRQKDGAIDLFTPPSFGADSACLGRGINSNGMVSGFVIDDLGVWRGFIHDPKKNTFEEFLASEMTIAHAINAQGQNVGSQNLDAGDAFPGSPPGRYGYLRQKDGSVKYFAISQAFPGQSRARGISESGLITGWFLDATTFEFMSFATTLESGTEFEEITLSDDEVIYQKPCDPNLPPPPGPGYDLFTDFTSSQIRNDGVVVGSCSDVYFNPGTGDFVARGYGFIATPIK